MEKTLASSINGGKNSSAKKVRSPERFDWILAPLSFTVTIFIFLPLIVYALNLTGVDVPLAVLLSWGVVACAAFTLVLAPLGRLPRVGRIIVVACQTGAVAAVVLTIFPNYTGELTGFEGSQIVNSSLPWVKLVGLVLAGIVIASKRPAWLRQAANLALVNALFVSLFIGCFIRSVRDGDPHAAMPADAAAVRMGTQKNVVVIVLDGFTGRRMFELKESYPEFQTALDGFTLYLHAIAPALNTSAGISAILTGDLRLAIEEEDGLARNARSLRESFLRDATTAGLNASYLSFLLPSARDGLENILIRNEQTFFEADRTPAESGVARYAGFWCVSLRRVVPETISVEVSRRLESILRPRGVSEDGDAALLASLQKPLDRAVVASGMSFEAVVRLLYVADGPGRVLFLHSKLSHPPYVFDERGNYKPGAPSGEAAVYAVRATVKMLRKLEALGIYDQTLIIVAADHGGMPLLDTESAGALALGGESTLGVNPLLMVKPPMARHPLRTETMDVWLGDVATTVRDLLGAPQKDEPLVASRSLLRPPDPGRRLDVPLYFRPDQAGYHDALSHWVRVDVLGGFVEYVNASLTDPAFLLKAGHTVRLFAGEDTLKTNLVRDGWLPGEGIQYRATIEVEERLLSKVHLAGRMITLSDESGVFEVRSFDEQKAVEALAELPPEATVLAVGLRISQGVVRRLFLGTQIEEGQAEPLNFVYVWGGKGIANDLRIARDDVNLELTWP